MGRFLLSRRDFSLGAAAAATAALIHPADAISATADLCQGEGPKSSPENENPLQKAMAKLSPEAQAEVEMKYAELLRKYGSRLTDEQKADAHRILAETQDSLEKMRAFALQNGDQPASVFNVRRHEGNRHAR